MPYLTPDVVPDTVTCRALFVPDNEQYLAIVRGAIQELTFSWNWTKYGLLTPDEAAASFMDMFDKFSFNEGSCRMIGELIMFAGATSPNVNWLVCDGSSVLIDDYPALYDVIGDTYGAALPTYFRLPDLAGRSPAGVGAGAGIPTVALGEYYGEAQHTLTELEIPAHVHTVDGHLPTPTLIGEIPSFGDAVTPSVTGSTGGSQAHNNLPPRLGINYLIVAKDG